MTHDKLTSLKHPSLAEIREGELVSRLMGNPYWRDRVIGIHGIPSNGTPLLEVPLKGLPGEPEGDIDILIVPPGRPEFSTAVQVKRVKVATTAFENDTPNMLQKLGKLFQQANLIAQIGFAQVYCFVFVVVDSRSNNECQLTYAGLTPILRTKISKAISTTGLAQRVGLVHYEFVQPMDNKPLDVGTYGGNLVRLAGQDIQPSEVTVWVQRVLKLHGFNA